MLELTHGGNLRLLARQCHCEESEILDFSSNLNPFGIPDGFFGAYFRAFDAITPYPDPHAEELSALAERAWGLPPGMLLFGNGSTELLSLIPKIVPARNAVIPAPSYLEYERVCRQAGLTTHAYPLKEECGFALDLESFDAFLRPGDFTILGSPNNPSGKLLDKNKLDSLIRRRPDVTFLLDAAFMDFCPEDASLIAPDMPANLLVTRSMTKFCALAGLRLGYCAAQPEMIAKLRAMQTPWSLGRAQIEVAKAWFSADFPRKDFIEKSRSGVAALREDLFQALSRFDALTVYRSEADYLLIRNDSGLDLISRLLQEHHIALRDCSAYQFLDRRYFRIAVRNREDNGRLIHALSTLLPCAPLPPVYLSLPKKRPALMLQGTCSSAGKSLLSAAFCRILLQDGIAVAPFKAQNMALNSAVTPDGGEIGRAQALQAEACRIDPDVRMNPILLKPRHDTGSQVILHGRVLADMTVREYYARKQSLFEEVKHAYDSLSRDYEAIVIEGAGSPAEINLKSGDLVNMRMARYAEAPVLLVGDIDRGGVYASFLGTYATFDAAERNLLKGFIVNKFRGDPSLLGPAHDYLYSFTGKKVVGVIDYLKDLHLPEEDSASFSLVRPAKKQKKLLDVAIIRLGHIANFTDFLPLELESDVALREVSDADSLGRPDLIFVPGSKGVASDLRQLHQTGLFDAIREAVLLRGVWYCGICGGLQIAGTTLSDPLGVESEERETSCLGLLNLVTEMKEDKILRRSSARHPSFGTLSGYEIHHGRSTPRDALLATAAADDGEILVYEREHIFCSYLHGIFDDDRFRRAFLDRIRVSRGLPALGGVSAHYSIEDSLNRLAAHLRERVDMKQLRRWMGLS